MDILVGGPALQIKSVGLLDLRPFVGLNLAARIGSFQSAEPSCRQEGKVDGSRIGVKPTNLEDEISQDVRIRIRVVFNKHVNK